METKVCLYCKQPFPARVSWQAFCCGSHRVLFSRKQDAGLLNKTDKKFAEQVDDLQSNPRKRFFYKPDFFWRAFGMKNKYHGWLRVVNPTNEGAYQILDLIKNDWEEITEEQYNEWNSGKDLKHWTDEKS